MPKKSFSGLKQKKLIFWIKFTQKRYFQSKKPQAAAFCVVNVNSTIVIKHFRDIKNLILNNLNEKLVIACLLGSFYLKLFQDGEAGRGGQKKPPTSFSHIISTNVGISPKNFPTLNFFVTLV